ncbi:RTA1 like protein [Diplocarpon rosae]|nr:RTA1 like protein [Diplocarpon rosae]
MSVNKEDCTLATCDVSISSIGYLPNVPGNAFLAAWFGLCLVAQLALSIKYKTWSHLAGQFFGLILELIGYVARVKLHDDPFNDKMFVIYIITVTIAPAFLCYTIYLTFGRIVIVYGTHLSVIPFRLYTIIFVTTDIICLVLQAGGAGWTQAKDIQPETLEKAINVLRAGLGMQVASLSIFIVLSADFAWRVLKKKNLWNTRFVDVREKKRFKPMLIGFFTAAILILARSAYRIEELSQGFVPPEDNAEILYMIFEGAMIGLASIILVACHPGPVFGSAWKATGFFSKQPKKGEVETGNAGHDVELISEDKHSGSNIHAQ